MFSSWPSIANIFFAYFPSTFSHHNLLSISLSATPKFQQLLISFILFSRYLSFLLRFQANFHIQLKYFRRESENKRLTNPKLSPPTRYKNIFKDWKEVSIHSRELAHRICFLSKVILDETEASWDRTGKKCSTELPSSVTLSFLSLSLTFIKEKGIPDPKFWWIEIGYKN